MALRPEIKGFVFACLVFLALAAMWWVMATFQIVGFVAIMGAFLFVAVWLVATTGFMDAER